MKLSLDKLLNRLQKCENVDLDVHHEGENSPESTPKVEKESVDNVSDVKRKCSKN